MDCQDFSVVCQLALPQVLPSHTKSIRCGLQRFCFLDTLQYPLHCNRPVTLQLSGDSSKIQPQHFEPNQQLPTLRPPTHLWSLPPTCQLADCSAQEAWPPGSWLYTWQEKQSRHLRCAGDPYAGSLKYVSTASAHRSCAQVSPQELTKSTKQITTDTVKSTSVEPSSSTQSEK